MDSTTNLASLPEESLEQEQEQRQHSHSQQQQEEDSRKTKPSPSSAFASVPDRPPMQSSSEKYSALDWMGYFDKERDVSIADADDVFHVYMAGTEGPVVFCLHGGGYSGLSFAMSAQIIKEKAQVVAMDMESSTENDLDLSVETMRNDVFAVVRAMYGDSPTAIVLVGHSMGGSVAVHVAAKKILRLRSVAGLLVVDVVEGTATASLIHLQKILSSSRMQPFSSIEKALCLPITAERN